ncbi:hypothetical protein EV127DRAFT_411566 [Xylaria flabelliformis]|nr:hypothetical protein EV127DRAFT_411566 [Xylaria flabelliformis]
MSNDRDWAWSPGADSRTSSIDLSRQSETDEDAHDSTPFYDESKINGVMGTSRQSKWREYLPRLPLHWRINDLRHLVILALVTLTVSLLLFAAHREVIGIARDDTTDLADQNYPINTEIEPEVKPDLKSETAPESEPEPEIELEPETRHPEVPGQCTTWPVDSNGNYKSRLHKSNLTLESFAPSGGWKKPQGIAVKALVFYGRKRTVDFLDCYLQQNLAINGGYLDEVWFMVHTHIEEDLEYLDELIKQRSPHYKTVMPGECEGFNYACMWNTVVEEDTIYVKIDDDIVFIHPDTIPQLVSTRIAEPHPFAVSANLVNSPFTGYKHYSVGAIHPFLPDPNSKPSQRAGQLWRPSDFKTIPKETVQKVYGDVKLDQVTEEIINNHVYAKPSYEGHPWLLLDNVENSLLKTPMGFNKLTADAVGGPYGAAWKSWMISAQQQYSLLRNLELNEMWRYHFGSQIEYPQGVNSSADAAALKFFDPNHLGPGAEQIYDTHYSRYNLNFVALWGHDIKKALPIADDDEQDLTVTKPERFQRPFVIDTRAVVGHLSFYPQHEGIRHTDLLDRWRALANEMVCTPENQRKPFDLRCPGY